MMPHDTLIAYCSHHGKYDIAYSEHLPRLEVKTITPYVYPVQNSYKPLSEIDSLQLKKE